MDCCSKDEGLVARFQKEVGPSNESSFDAVKRAYEGFTNRIYNNVRADYDESRDLLPAVDPELFEFNCFKIRTADNVNLACCHLEFKKREQEQTSIVLFLHTNTRNLLQALEILPFCIETQSSLLAYDLRGCGKSEGLGLSSLDKHVSDLDRVISWVQSRTGGKSKIVLWARGMSTATAIYHAAGPYARSEPAFSYPVSFVVLDSPFTSVEDMVNECFERLKRLGYILPEAVFSLGVGLVRSTLRSRLGDMDPFDVRPLERVEFCAVPCCVLICANDDYAPVDMGLAVVQQWLGPAQSRQFNGSHFSRREPDVVLWPAQSARAFLAGVEEEMPDCRVADTWREIETGDAGDAGDAEEPSKP